jgi:NhaA family Na+:H+ antiporter
MERPVSLLVVPIFAFLNAGIALSAETLCVMGSSPMSWGVIGGLVIGKPLGIVLMSWLTVKLGWGDLPKEVGLTHLLGLGLLAGMGFTMSIFIAILSFGTQPQLLKVAKASIMLATAAAGLMGILLLWFLSHRKKSSHNHQK